MGFFSDPIWWALTVGASTLFALHSAMGLQGPKNPIKNLFRTGFVTLVVLAFMFNGWQSGLGIGVGSALMGYLVPAIIGRVLVRQVLAVPAKPAAPLQTEQLSLGRRALVRDMILNGVSRQKVWRLVQQGRLTAYEDTKDGRITLARPEDLEALQGVQQRERNEGRDEAPGSPRHG